MRKGGEATKNLSTRPQPATIEENLIELLGTRGRGPEGFSLAQRTFLVFIWALNMCVYLFAFCF